MYHAFLVQEGDTKSHLVEDELGFCIHESTVRDADVVEEVSGADKIHHEVAVRSRCLVRDPSSTRDLLLTSNDRC